MQWLQTLKYMLYSSIQHSVTQGLICSYVTASPSLSDIKTKMLEGQLSKAANQRMQKMLLFMCSFNAQLDKVKTKATEKAFSLTEIQTKIKVI